MTKSSSTSTPSGSNGNKSSTSAPNNISSPPKPPRNTARKQSRIVYSAIVLIVSGMIAFGAFLYQWSLIDPTFSAINNISSSSSNAGTLASCPRHPTNNLNDRQVDLHTFNLSSDNEEIPLECFFSSNFYEAQALFKQSGSKTPNAQLFRLPVIEGEASLCTDIVYIPGNPNKVLIHISGTHGPEGFAGSAVQSAALQYLSNPNNYQRSESTPTIFFLHAMNPYGFANNRRVNEENIDLNRNFLKDKEFEFVKSRDPNFAGYVDIDEYINPTSKPFQTLWLNELYGYGMMAKAYLIHGFAKMKRALVSGNYFKPTGLGFGGFGLSRSAQNMNGFLQHFQINSQAEKVVLIDVHTGLGPIGQDTLMIDLNPYTEEERQKIRELFPLDVNHTSNATIGGIMENFKGSVDSNSASSGYDLTVGTVSGHFCDQWLAPKLDKNSKLCFTQEFGTLSPMIVGKYSVDENYAFHHGTLEEKEFYGNRLRSAFYVETKFWKRNIVRRGLALFLQGLYALEHAM